MSTPKTFFYRAALLVLAPVLAASVASCSTTASGEAAQPTSSAVASAGTLFDSSKVHDVDITAATADIEKALAAYAEDDDKTWISASVTIDGTAYEDVGLRLKGNSSLRSTKADDAANPETLPWLVRLDKYVDGQSAGGVTSFVIRSNTTETSLNEAVALELIGMSGLATEDPAASRVSFNGGDQALRLIIENPDEAWANEQFDAVGTLYKAKSTGDYSYRGDAASDYDDVFSVKAGADDFAPLAAFLKFVNDSDDETFAAELGDYLDTDAFATYLAVQDLVANEDDISGPGNNSYLHYDPETQLMTVVSWDQNLSFGVRNGGPGGAPAGGPGEAGEERGDRPEPPAGGARPSGAPPAGGTAANGQRPQGGGMSRGNVLAERFLDNDAFKKLYTERLAELKQTLYADGAAQEVLTRWTDLLTDQASDLVSAQTITSEAEAIAKQFE